MSHAAVGHGPGDSLEVLAAELFSQHQEQVHRRVDRLFAWLMVGQWLFALTVALLRSPYSWEGQVRAVHVHVYAALFLGGALSAFPILLAWLRPGEVRTRYAMAVSQPLWSALLIHLTGGRIETHFHVFGSLAFLAFYRDGLLLLTASAIVVADHFGRGALWPESIYGTLSPEWWRFLEHTFWVLFLDIVLLHSCRSSQREMRAMAERQAAVELSSRQLSDSLKQLHATRAQLLLADRLAVIGQLAAGVGHELNNPLAYVLSNITYVHDELSQTKSAPTVEQRQELLSAMTDAREGAERMRLIVQDLKTLSRPADPGRGVADLRAVVQTAVKMASREIGCRARMVEQCGDVPPVQASEGRLGQVFLNLLINAAHAIPEGQVEHHEIRVMARQHEPGFVTVEVSDTGCGIPSANLERIFDPFFTTKPQGEGTGLGLSVSHSIVTSLGGSMSVESKVGQGTTFRLRLPTAEGAPQPRPAPTLAQAR